MADELISRQALIDALYDSEYTTLCPLDEVSGVVCAVPAVDAVPVVRCKDCGLSKESCFGDGWRYCRNNQHHHKDCHFCGYGEQREEND